MIFWWLVRYIIRRGKHTHWGCQCVSIGPIDLLCSTRHEMNRKGWLLRGRDSKMANRLDEPISVGEKIRQITIIAPRACLPIHKIFERYEDYDKSHKRSKRWVHTK